MRTALHALVPWVRPAGAAGDGAGTGTGGPGPERDVTRAATDDPPTPTDAAAASDSVTGDGGGDGDGDSDGTDGDSTDPDDSRRDDDGENGDSWIPASLDGSGDDRRLLLALVGVSAVAVAVRLFALGRRVAYYDEAWLGYWVLRANETGLWEYRPIVHGPFFARVNGPLFAAVGASDTTARLVVALLGGLVPLAAWLYRERLSRAETLVTGLLLAGTPLLVYYSRFMRNDVPLAVFAVLTVGFAVRFADTGRPRYLHAGALSLALAFTTKESALLYVLTWVGAGALVADSTLLAARARSDDSVRGTVARAADRTAAAGRRLWPHLVGAGVLFLAVVVYFYAPRTPPGEPGLRTLLSDPTTVPAVVGEATLGSFESAVEHWVAGGKQRHAYLPYLVDTVRTLGAGSLAVVVLAPVGFLADRHLGDGRPLVGFSTYAGAAAVVGYPLANNFPVPWSAVHAVAPLTVPAAVGAVFLVRRAVAGLTTAADADATPPGAVADGGDRSPGRPDAVAVLRAVVVAVVLVALAVQAAGVTATTSYLQPHESPEDDPGSEVVYYAQAPAEIANVRAAIRQAAATPDEPDVVYVGRSLAAEEEGLSRPPPPGAFYARNPFPWYTEAHGATVESHASPSGLADVSRPAVVVTTEEHRDSVADRLPDDYAVQQYPLDDRGDRSVVVFFRPPDDG